MSYRGPLDIVERLRESPLPSLNRMGQDRKDAADEIEDLRMTVSGLNKDWNKLLEVLRAVNEFDANGFAVAPMPFALRKRVEEALALVGTSPQPGTSSRAAESAGGQTGGSK